MQFWWCDADGGQACFLAYIFESVRAIERATAINLLISRADRYQFLSLQMHKFNINDIK